MLTEHPQIILAGSLVTPVEIWNDVWSGTGGGGGGGVGPVRCQLFFLPLVDSIRQIEKAGEESWEESSFFPAA